MQETDTKPLIVTATEEARTVLRAVFSVESALVPPAIIRVAENGVMIGRDVAQGVQIDDARISRHHATVRRSRAGQLTIADEQSKNGTFVNGVRVRERGLAHGDVISVGDSCLVVAEEPTHANDTDVPSLLGDSASMRRARSFITTVGPTPRTVLLVAETGCGKEVVARGLHEASGLTGAFVAVNCAAVPDSLFESELFGHVAGAFTGATAQPGFFRAAIGGTLFLDEIGELPIALQPKLLRAIQERAVVPLGTTRPVPCPVRIIAATNQDLTVRVERGAFRADLFARLFEAHIALPPLRERREDILLLFASALGGAKVRMTHSLAEALLLHDWSFNVRDLLAAARDIAAASAEGAIFDVITFQKRLTALGLKAPRSTPAPRPRSEAPPPNAEELSKILREKHGAVVDVARALGRSRRQVYRWIEKYGLRIEDFRS